MKSISRLMIVDDDLCCIRFFEEVVGDDYDLFCTTNGEDALDALIGFRPDMLLLDIVLPGISGIEVCSRVRAIESFSEVAIIICSALAMDIDIEKGYKAGADHYLAKPFDHIQLLSLLHSLPANTTMSNPRKDPFPIDFLIPNPN